MTSTNENQRLPPESPSTSVGVPTGNAYDKYASKHKIERVVMDKFLAQLDRQLLRINPTSVIEVGMGEGEILERLIALFPDATIAGIDLPDSDLVGSWRERGLRAVAGDAYSLPFADDCADLVMAIEVLEHLEDPDAALKEMARVGRNKFLFSVPLEPLWRAGNLIRRRYVKELGNTPGHVQHFSRRKFASLIGNHFEVLQVMRPLPWTMILAGAKDT